MRRLAALLIAVALVLTGAVLAPCPDGRCAMKQARSMACCQQDGLTKPSCCEAPAQLSQAVPAGVPERGIDVGAAHGGVHAAAIGVAVVPAAAPASPRLGRELTRAKSPPGTLVARHTSLLL